MLTRREFIKTIITRPDSIFDNEKGAVKDAYDHSPEAYQNMLTYRDSLTIQDKMQEKMDNSIDIETYEICKVEQTKQENISNIEKERRQKGFSQNKYDQSMQLIGLKNEHIKPEA